MEVKTSLLDNMIGVGDMVLLEPLSEETFINNLKKRFDHNEIYVSIHTKGHLWGLDFVFCGTELASFLQTLLFSVCLLESRGICLISQKEFYVCSFGT